MANIDLKFLDSIDDKDFVKVEKSSQIFESVNKKDLIRISGEEFNASFEVFLDKSTAIKFAKTLRTEINKIQD